MKVNLHPFFSGREFVFKMILRYGVEEVDREYNGIGAEWMGATVRGWLTRLFPEFEGPCYIHDVRTAWRPISSTEANRELLKNCRLAALISKRPHRLMVAAYAFYLACQIFGAHYSAANNGDDDL